MHRLFIAIRPPLFIRSQLLTLMEGIAGARWQNDDQLHLTLRFIGEVDQYMANDLADLLGTVRFHPFTVELGSVGCFASNGRPNSLWVGLRPCDALMILHRKIDHLCVTLGLKPDARAYLPHITIARCGRSTASVEPFMKRHANFSSAPFEVSGFSLYESHLGGEGATYNQVAHYPA
ncbi:RNA 2',3'-cyclic phosphodiesterase [Sphingobium baderi]|uniref:RNA 2',3'-cyclic phosphodiesterase n=1 Tax=Sphingobium baderi TaxID=1332080 RepID=A0A0S3F291_9SPHN|nr:RNA 2',3'-cyclic phosphodiesterase [Sphingobium baderi]ALR21767.1 2'-5' RNA ligase [Sphingobium baderi]